MKSTQRLRELLARPGAVMAPGVADALNARLVKRHGFEAIYMTGAGTTAVRLGMPDVGLLTATEMIDNAGRIAEASGLPLIADADNGYGGVLNVRRTIQGYERAGVAAVHLEDQVQAKRCGHRPGKEIVPRDEMVDRIKAAADARTDPDFVIMARTDALAVEGLQAAIDRACACVEAGADMVFPEAMTELSMYKKFADAVKVPILANITEFGSTPLFTIDELREANVSLVLYPLSAFRAMNLAALNVYRAIRRDGTQKNVLDTMQTRADLYDYLDYHAYEQKLDQLFAKEKHR